jgi:hypothetical protein
VTTEKPIAWTSRIPVKSVVNSFTFTIFSLEEETSLKTLMAEIFEKEQDEPAEE